MAASALGRQLVPSPRTKQSMRVVPTTWTRTFCHGWGDLPLREMRCRFLLQLHVPHQTLAEAGSGWHSASQATVRAVGSGCCDRGPCAVFSLQPSRDIYGLVRHPLACFSEPLFLWASILGGRWCTSTNFWLLRPLCIFGSL